MRISTQQIFNTSLDTMLEQQAKLVRSQEQVGSGLKFLAPSDDPGAAARVADIQSNRSLLAQFQENSTAAESQLALTESVLDKVDDNLQRVRELAVQAANATNSDQSRAAIAVEVRERLSELVAMANTRDAAGEYIFAGSAVSSQPFTEAGGSVSYSGDQTQRELQVGEGMRVAVRNSGAEVFLSSRSGNGQVAVQVGAGNAGNLVVNGFDADGSFVPDTYSLAFSQPTPGDPITYTVTDSSAGVVATGPWTEGDPIQFAGVQLNFVGLPADGDTVQVQPSTRRDIFAVVESLAAALEVPRTDARSGAVQQNAINTGLDELDQALQHVNDVRASAGARLNIVDSQRAINADFDFQLETALSENRDLDYTEAISRFNTQLVALQAAQQTYVRTQSLNLFSLL